MSSAAVLAPMPGTPGTLSMLSPQSAWTSATLSGPTPNFSRTSSSRIGRCLARIGGDQIIRFVAFEFDRADIEGRGGLAYQLELRHEVRRRLWAMRLILVVKLVAEARLGAIEHHRKVVGVGVL